MKNAFLGIAVVAGIVLLSVAGWFGYWWLAKSSVAHQYDINTTTQQYQASLISQERDRAQAYETADDPGQKKQIALTFCEVYMTITTPPFDLVSAQPNICQGVQ